MSRTPVVAIVGSGIMGAVAAADLRRRVPDADVVMIEAGPVRGAVPGAHLHDVADERERAAYNAHVAAGVQSMYVGAATAGDFEDPATAPAGLYSFAALGHDTAAMPAAATGWNVGGMGAHWTAACPDPWGAEIPAAIDPAQWRDDLAHVKELLRITPDLFGPTAAGEAVLSRLASAFGEASAPGRGPQVMPMAVAPGPDGTGRERTGPAVIHPPIARGAARFRLLTGTIVRRIVVERGRATGVECVDAATGGSSRVDADVVLVCADALRTPQLLFASGIRPAALGRGLNEHAFLTGRVFATPEQLGVEAIPPVEPGEWMSDSLWLPHSGADQPFHWQLSVGPLFSDDLSRIVAASVGVSVYVPTEIDDESRIEFSATRTDRLGLPAARIAYRYSAADAALIERARADQQRAYRAIAGEDARADSLLLPPGSSLHYSGTVRMGDGPDEGVVDADGRVWGVGNLFAAGNGVLPTAVVGNVTLTGAVTAVRAARAIASDLGPRSGRHGVVD